MSRYGKSAIAPSLFLGCTTVMIIRKNPSCFSVDRNPETRIKITGYTANGSQQPPKGKGEGDITGSVPLPKHYSATAADIRTEPSPAPCPWYAVPDKEKCEFQKD